MVLDEYLYFIVYLISTWIFIFILIKILFYKKYFFHIIPFIIIFSVLGAILLYKLRFEKYYWWYLV